jgi:hypothetical protein
LHTGERISAYTDTYADDYTDVYNHNKHYLTLTDVSTFLYVQSGGDASVVPSSCTINVTLSAQQVPNSIVLLLLPSTSRADPKRYQTQQPKRDDAGPLHTDGQTAAGSIDGYNHHKHCLPLPDSELTAEMLSESQQPSHLSVSPRNSELFASHCSQGRGRNTVPISAATPPNDGSAVFMQKCM